MRHRGAPMLILDALDDGQRLVACAAAGAVSDGTKIRLQLHQPGYGLLQQVAIALVRLRRGKLEGNNGRLAALGIVNVANELHVAVNCVCCRPSVQVSGKPCFSWPQLGTRTIEYRSISRIPKPD